MTLIRLETKLIKLMRELLRLLNERADVTLRVGEWNVP